MNSCEAGHDKHDTIIVPTKPWSGRRMKMEVYDAEKYRDTRGYCTGDDVLSRALTDGGTWEAHDTKILMDRHVFDHGGWVLDVGSHIGWYSLIAALRGCDVIAFEGDPENADLLRRNSRLNKVEDKVEVRTEWVDENWDPDLPHFSRPVDLIKVDLEGKDIYAVDALWPLVESGVVRHMLIEISPVFSSGYPEMVERVCEAGFDALVCQREPFALPSFEWVEGCHQVDILFSRV